MGHFKGPRKLRDQVEVSLLEGYLVSSERWEAAKGQSDKRVGIKGAAEGLVRSGRAAGAGFQKAADTFLRCRRGTYRTEIYEVPEALADALGLPKPGSDEDRKMLEESVPLSEFLDTLDRERLRDRIDRLLPWLHRER